MKKKLLAAVLVAVVAVPLFAVRWYPIGHAVYAPTTATTLASTPTSGVTLPANAIHAILTVQDQSIRLWYDGTTPDASTGHLYPAGTVLKFTSERVVLEKIKFIEAVSGAHVSVDYFSD